MKRVGAVALVALSVVLGARVAHAIHNWQGSHPHDVSPMTVFVDTDTIGSEKRNRIWRAAYSSTYSWNIWTTPIWGFDWGGPAALGADPIGFFFEAPLDPAVNGVTAIAEPNVGAQNRQAHVMVGAFTVMNANQDWYTGTGDSPNDEIDYWSVASHELGHWLGLGDLAAGVDPACPGDIGDATMCTGYTNPGGIDRRRQPDTDEDQDSIAISNAVCEFERVCAPQPAEWGREPFGDYLRLEYVGRASAVVDRR